MSMALIAFIIAGSFEALTHFRKAYDSGEKSSEMLREISRFIEYLRKDLHNAAPPADTKGTKCRDWVKCSAGELSFPIFSDTGGTIQTVRYSVAGNSIQRSLDSAEVKALITDSLASLSWSLGEDGVNSVSPFQAGRIWIHLEALFGKTDPTGKLTKAFPLSTNLFPVRWNRTIQRTPASQ